MRVGYINVSSAGSSGPPKTGKGTKCEGWDLNPRTSTGLGPQPSAVDHAWLPSLSGRVNKEEIERFKSWLQNEKRISESTAKMYAWTAGKALKKIGRAIPSEEDIEGYRERMRSNGLASSSRSNTLMALQHWLGFNGIDASFKKPKRNHRSPTYLTESEANRLIEACENAREKAVVTILLYSGLRASELCALDRTDIDFEENLIHVRKGKGNTDEYVAVDRKALECVRTLFNQREDTEPMVFTNRRGSRYTRKGIEGIVSKVAERAKIAKHVTPHVLRHTLATNLLKNGCSLPLIQQQLRHKQIGTTMIYLHSNKEMLKSAYEKHKPSY